MKKNLLSLLLIIVSILSAEAQGSCSTAATAIVGLNTVGTVNGTLLDGCGNTWSATYANWFVYNSTISGIVTVTSDLSQNDGSVYSDDTYLNVYSGSCGALTCIGYNDDTADNYLSTLTFTVEPGVSYYIEWADEWDDTGFQFELTATAVTCPSTITPPYTEDFANDAQIYVCWDLIDDDGDGYGWFVSDYDLDLDGNPDGNPCLASASYDNDTFSALTPDNWIISLPVDLTSFDSSYDIALEWLARGIDENYPDENYSVYVAAGNTQTDFLSSPASFTEIIGQTGGAGEVFVSRSLDISQYAGQTVYFAFRHYDVTDQYQLNIDDVTVTTTLSSKQFNLGDFTYSYDRNYKALTIFSSDANISGVEIYTIVGQKVFSETNMNTQTKEIDMSHVTDGVYIVNVFDANNGFKSFKLIKR